MFHEIYVFSLKKGLISIFLEIKWLFYPQKCNFAAKKLCKFEFCVTTLVDLLVTTHKNGGANQPFVAKKFGTKFSYLDLKSAILPAK